MIGKTSNLINIGWWSTAGFSLALWWEEAFMCITSQGVQPHTQRPLPDCSAEMGQRDLLLVDLGEQTTGWS